MSLEARLQQAKGALEARQREIDAILDEAETLIAEGKAGAFPGWDNLADPAECDFTGWTHAHFDRALEIVQRWENPPNPKE